jgi:hypothetical protein
MIWRILILAGCLSGPGPWPAACGQTIDQKLPIRIEGMVTASADEAISRGLQWLASRHNADGSFGDDRLLKGNTAVCGLAGLAFLCEGSTTERGPYAANIRRCLDFLASHFDEESGLIDYPRYQSSGPMYGHGFATLFVAEAWGMPGTEAWKTRIARAVDLIVATQHESGGWRYQPRPDDADLSVTVCQVMALRAAKNAGFVVPAETVDRAIRYIRLSQNDDGGFCYRLDGLRESGFARSAAALVGLQSAGIYSGAALDRGIGYLFRSRPNVQDRDGSYYFYGHYYAAQALWQTGGTPWERWFPPVRDELIALQETPGNWPGKYSAEYSTAMALIVLQVPNNLLPIFQR